MTNIDKLIEWMAKLELNWQEGSYDICTIKEGHTHLMPTGISKILNLQVSREGECPKCNGSKVLFSSLENCPFCHGTGKQAVTKTIIEWLEVVLR